jgi:hypothetical protein
MARQSSSMRLPAWKYHTLVPAEVAFIRNRSLPPALTSPSSEPAVAPPTNKKPLLTRTLYPKSSSEEPICFDHCNVPASLYLVSMMSKPPRALCPENTPLV